MLEIKSIRLHQNFKSIPRKGIMSTYKKRGRSTEQQTQEYIPNEFDVLRDLVKNHNEIKQYEYVEKITKSWKEYNVFDKKKEFILDVCSDLSVNDLQIYLEVGGHVGSSHRVNVVLICVEIYM